MFVKDSPIEVFDENSNTTVDHPITSNTESVTENSTPMVELREVMAKSVNNTTRVFDIVCELNAELQKGMKQLATKYDQDMKIWTDRNQQLIDVQKGRELDAKKAIDGLKMKIDLLEVEKTNLISEQCKVIEIKDRERIEAVNEAKKRCEENYANQLANAKKMKFCAACDNAKPQDTFFFCKSECQMRYW